MAIPWFFCLHFKKDNCNENNILRLTGPVVYNLAVLVLAHLSGVWLNGKHEAFRRPTCAAPATVSRCPLRTHRPQYHCAIAWEGRRLFQTLFERPVARIPAKCDWLYRGRGRSANAFLPFSGFSRHSFFLPCLFAVRFLIWVGGDAGPVR